MTKSFTLLAVLLLTLFSPDKNSSDIQLKKLMVGKWSVCSINYYDENGQNSSSKFNVCPRIIFNKDGTGSILGGGKFNWSIKNNIFKIADSDDEDDDDLLGLGGEMTITHTKIKGYYQVKLLDKSRRAEYVLSRSIKH